MSVSIHDHPFRTRSLYSSRWFPAHCGLFATIMLLLIPRVGNGQAIPSETERSAELSAIGARAVSIESPSGTLTVIGDPRLRNVEARAIIHAPSDSILRSMAVSLIRDGDMIRIAPSLPAPVARDLTRGYSCGCRIDLTVRLPQSLPVHVNTETGRAYIRDVRSLDLVSGIAPVQVQNILGPVHIRMGAAGATVTDVQGDVTATTGPSHVTLERVMGSVTIDTLGAAGVTLRHIRGDVRIGWMGAGPVVAEDVGGGLYVEERGPGEVRYALVKGKIRVPPPSADSIGH